MKLTEMIKADRPYTALAYCAPGVGKSTFIGLCAEKTDGQVLVLDIDRTFVNTIAKDEVVHKFDNIEVWQIDNVNTWADWIEKLKELKAMSDAGNMPYKMIAVDNVSELERCILSDLGRQGKNKGVPAQADYQYMQFKMTDSLRMLKSLGCDVIWTAWETFTDYVMPDGTSYTRSYPKISNKIVDNICGLCDVVAKIAVGKEGQRGLILEATQNTYAKNQRDSRKGCLAEEFIIKNETKKKEVKKDAE